MVDTELADDGTIPLGIGELAPFSWAGMATAGASITFDLACQFGAAPFSSCNATTDPVAAAFGAISTVAGSNQIFQTATNCDQSSSLLTGVNSWEYHSGTTYTTNDGVVCTTNAFPNGDASLIAKEVGQGCVVISGDSNMLEDMFIVDEDTRQLALNMLLFLNQCNPALVGGELLPIESTALILAGAQSFSWMIPLMLSVLGIGLFVVSRKS